MDDPESLPLTEGLLPPSSEDAAPLSGLEDKTSESAEEGKNGTSRLCGMKKTTACIVIGLVLAALITGITLAVIYGRPPDPDWKVTGTMDGPAGMGSQIAISGDGKVVALKINKDTSGLDSEYGVGIKKDFAVQLVATGPSTRLDENGAPQYFNPFSAGNDEYPLPVNSESGSSFDPAWIMGTFALNDNGDTLVVLGVAILWDNWIVAEGRHYGLCNEDGKGNIKTRYGYKYWECKYGRVSTFRRNDDGNWNQEPIGQPIEVITPSPRLYDQNKVDNSPESVSLSGDGKTLAIGYRGHVELYGKDDSTATKWKQIGESIQGDNVRFGDSVSLNGDGARVAIGGFESTAVSVYTKQGDLWQIIGDGITGSGPGDFGLTVSLSSSGNRLAVVARDHLYATKYDNDIPYEEQDAARVLVYELQGDSWTRLGNDIVGYDQCCLSPGQGYGVKMSSDGSTIVVGGSDASLQPYRFDGKQSWKPLGKKLPVAVDKGMRATVTSDGNQVAFVEFESAFGPPSYEETSHLKMYTLRR